MRNLHQHAFSLLEVIFTLALIGTGLSVAAPTLSALLERNRQLALRDSLHASLEQARALAILQRYKVEICGSSDGLRCQNDWHYGWLVRRSEDNQNPLEHIKLAQGSNLQWSGFDKTIRFHTNGTSPTGNGRFYQCHNGKIRWQLIINRQGRVRHGSERENISSVDKCTP